MRGTAGGLINIMAIKLMAVKLTAIMLGNADEVLCERNMDGTPRKYDVKLIAFPLDKI